MISQEKYQKGFTLIEMIVVFAVVAIIGVLAVSTYSGTRRQARLDIAVDAFVSAMREQSGKAKNGQLLPFSQSIQQLPNAQADQQYLKSACFGIVLDTQAEPLTMEAFPYVAVTQDSRADICDPHQVQKFPYKSFEELEVREILVNGQQKYNQLKIFFKPPFAKMITFNEEEILTNVQTIRVTFGSKNASQNPLKRCVLVNSQNNLITPLNENSC